MIAELRLRPTRRSPDGVSYRHTAVLILSGIGWAADAARVERIARAMAPGTWPQELPFALQSIPRVDGDAEAVWIVTVDRPASG